MSDSRHLGASEKSPAQQPGTAFKARSTTPPAIGKDDLDSSAIPHLTDDSHKTLVEVAPGIEPVEVYPDTTDTENEVRGSDKETGGFPTDDTDDDGLPQSKFDPLKFLTEIFTSM